MSILNLFKPSWKHFGVNLHEAATRKISNERVLSLIAKNDRAIEVQIAAVEGINDQGLLLDLVRNSKYSDVRSMAMYKVTIQTIFAEFLKNYDDGIKLIVFKLTELKEGADNFEFQFGKFDLTEYPQYHVIRMIGEGLFKYGGVQLMQRISKEVNLQDSEYPNGNIEDWWYEIY